MQPFERPPFDAPNPDPEIYILLVCLNIAKPSDCNASNRRGKRHKEGEREKIIRVHWALTSAGMGKEQYPGDEKANMKPGLIALSKTWISQSAFMCRFMEAEAQVL